MNIPTAGKGTCFKHYMEEKEIVLGNNILDM